MIINSLPDLTNDKFPTPINGLNKKLWKQNTLQIDLTRKLKQMSAKWFLFKIFN